MLQAPSTFHELFILFITILWGRLIIMLLFSQGNRGSERVSGLPRSAQQISSCPWIQTWVCSTLKPVLASLCLYHIAVVLSPCPGSWLSAWTTLAFDATLQSAPALLFSCPSQVCTTFVSWLLGSDAHLAGPWTHTALACFLLVHMVLIQGFPHLSAHGLLAGPDQWDAWH